MPRANRSIIGWEACKQSYREMVDDAVGRADLRQRDRQWTESIAVGRATFVASVEAALEQEDRRRRMDRHETQRGTWILREQCPHLGLYAENEPNY